LGEKFPLFLRGLSLEGAGRDQTFVVGTGTLVHSAEGGPLREQYLVTVVAGDRTLETVISRLSIRSESPVPTSNYYGVFCDRGSATGEVAEPGGQTKLENVAVGPGYQGSVLATTSTAPSVTGCNVVVRSSLLTGGWAGVRALGCDPVAREPRTIEQLDAPAGQRRGPGCRGPGGAAADDQYVRRLSHRRDAYRARAASPPAPRPSDTRFASSL